MIILDTCTIIFDALSPEKLSLQAKKSLIQAEKNNQLFCCDISLWEIAMMIKKKRIDPGTDTITFLDLIMQARKIQIIPINLEIAALSVDYADFNHYDPADRLIAATAIHYKAGLITCDNKLNEIKDINIIW